jgi:hypothetical protein
MQTQDLESVTTAEPNEQIDAGERQPYQAPCLVRMELSKTLGSAGTISDGITVTS